MAHYETLISKRTIETHIGNILFERESFGALHQMLTGVNEAERESVWEEIANELRKFEGSEGFEGLCEMLIAVGTK